MEVGLSTVLEQTAPQHNAVESGTRAHQNGCSFGNGLPGSDLSFDEDLPSAADFSIDPLRSGSVFDEFKDFELERNGSLTPYNASVESFEYFSNNE